jgi:hypothetical protein
LEGRFRGRNMVAEVLGEEVPVVDPIEREEGEEVSGSNSVSEELKSGTRDEVSESGFAGVVFLGNGQSDKSVVVTLEKTGVVAVDCDELTSGVDS